MYLQMSKFQFTEPTTISLDLQVDNNNLYSSSNNRALLENRANKDKSSTGSNNNKNFKNIANTEQQIDSFVHVKKKQMTPIIKGERETRIRERAVLAHSSIPLYPLKTVNEAEFLPQMHKEMMHMHIYKIYRIQVFAWSHLLRNNSLFIINPSKSSKTWSYLPVLCNDIYDIYYDVNGTTSTYGPVATVLVASAKHVEEVTGLCQHLLFSLKDEVPIIVGSFGLRNFKDTKIKLLNSCGVLVTTPSSLLRLFRDNENEHLFDAKRLKRIVIDDMDLMLSRALGDFQIALKALFTMFKKSEAKTLKAQIVVTFRYWDFCRNFHLCVDSWKAFQVIDAAIEINNNNNEINAHIENANEDTKRENDNEINPETTSWKPVLLLINAPNDWQKIYEDSPRRPCKLEEKCQ
uniref:RNA helicase n=1 Tax=Glossina austeni TaxID=7395 RepID=A0A1A9UKY4_GLOAU